jgi:hypothetical protein
MSCSSSSNIRSQLFSQTVYVQSSGTRIAFSIDTSNTGYTIGSGITGGSVVRFDPVNQSYQLSNAKQADAAEVIGVVESFSSSSGITAYTIVANGLINYPTLSSIPDYYTYGGACSPQTSLSGGDGGKDIMFLSDGCSGAVQYLEPTTPGSIVKPIMQRLNLTGYNAIVLNYIGYEVGNQAQAEFPISGLVGSITYVIQGSPVPFGYFDITNEVQGVSTTEYPELYAIFGVEYGKYVEKVTITTTPGNWTNYVAQQTGINTGTIESVDIPNKILYIKRNAGQLQTDTGVPILLGTNSNQLTISVTPVASTNDVVKFTIPASPARTTTFTSSTTQAVNVSMTPLMKGKNDLTFVSVTDNLKLQGLSLGSYNNVETTLQALCTDTGVC